MNRIIPISLAIVLLGLAAPPASAWRGGAVYHGPNGGAAVRGPYGGYAARAPNVYGGYYRAPGAVAAGVAVGAAVGAAMQQRPYYPPPYYAPPCGHSLHAELPLDRPRGRRRNDNSLKTLN